MRHDDLLTSYLRLEYDFKFHQSATPYSRPYFDFR